MTRCSSCAAEVEWVKTEYAKWQPLDPTPSLLGNVELREGIAFFVRDGQRDGRMLRVPHYATCPHAKRRRNSAT